MSKKYWESNIYASSKSLYTRGLQCVKSLWLKKYRSDLLTPSDAAANAIFTSGNRVGDLACQLFPGGIEILYDNTSFDEKVTMTQDLIHQGKNIIYEATFVSKYNGHGRYFNDI